GRTVEDPPVPSPKNPTGETPPEPPAGTPRGGLNPDALKHPGAQTLAVGDTFKCSPPRQYQILAIGKFGRCLAKLHDYLFRHLLDRQGHIHVNLRNLRFGPSPWHAKKLLPLVLENHSKASGIAEVIHIKENRTILSDIHEIGLNFPHKILHLRRLRIAVRRQPHKLVLAAVHHETCVVSESGVKEPDRVRKAQFLQ